MEKQRTRRVCWQMRPAGRLYQMSLCCVLARETHGPSYNVCEAVEKSRDHAGRYPNDQDRPRIERPRRKGMGRRGGVLARHWLAFLVSIILITICDCLLGHLVRPSGRLCSNMKSNRELDQRGKGSRRITPNSHRVAS